MSLALSVITICFRNPEELRLTLQSLAGLTPGLCEVIIVDGSPDDQCAQIARQFPAFRHLHGPDTGKYDAMNKGIVAAMGDAVLFMNSGDMLHDRLRLEDILERKRDRLTDTLLFGDSIRVVAGERIYTPAVDPSADTQRLAVFPSHQSILVPRSYHLNHRFDDSMYFAADSKMLKTAFDELPCEHLDFAIGEFSYGGACTSPGSWTLLRKQYGELLDVADYTPLEKVKLAVSLTRRKMAHLAFGDAALQRAQARRLRRKLARQSSAGTVR